jgi:hypothetical protein
MSVQDDDCLPGELPWSVDQVSTEEKRVRRGSRSQRSSSEHPLPPRRGRRWPPPETWHGPLNDESEEVK